MWMQSSMGVHIQIHSFGMIHTIKLQSFFLKANMLQLIVIDVINEQKQLLTEVRNK